MAKEPWRRSSPEMVERFSAGVAGIEGLEQRQMFGYPAAFIGGNLTTSLHRESWIVRLATEERAEQQARGWQTFAPMAGRPMREYLVMPDAVAADPDQARSWVEKAAAYVRTLPPKTSKKR